MSTKYKNAPEEADAYSVVPYVPKMKMVVSSPLQYVLFSVLVVSAAVAMYCVLSVTIDTAINYQSIFHMALPQDTNLTISHSSIARPQNHFITPSPPSHVTYPPIVCPSDDHALANINCPAPPQPTTSFPRNNSAPVSTCPDYFRYIHDDLHPWRETGITRRALEAGKDTTHFRVVVQGGRLYVALHGDLCYDTRFEFTIWGFLQLIRRYPGRVPDLELMFNCMDKPMVMSKEYKNMTVWPPPPPIPPVFHYCGDDETLDIVFPDWSFWGWPQLMIKHWGEFSEELNEGNKMTAWKDREPYAYWKGNPYLADTRIDLFTCNVTEEEDWNARLFNVDWEAERRRAFNESDLTKECNYRYKIYIEGIAWSVSRKYILSCNSPTLLVTPRYYDFFSRALVPLRHYWPINTTDKCSSIKFAVDWGNAHHQEAQAMGHAGSRFIQEVLGMDYVYDYMLHLLTEYAKLLKFNPEVPSTAQELCPERLACVMENPTREFLIQSMVNASTDTVPCSMPPPFSTEEREVTKRMKKKAINLVENWQLTGTVE